MAARALWVLALTALCTLPQLVAASSDDASTKSTEDSIFSVPAFFVVFREACEAAVILGVCLGFLDKAGAAGKSRKKHVWLGAALGLVLALIAGVIFIAIFYVLGNNVFSGDAKAIFEGILSWFAAIIITVLAAGMCGMAKFKERWEAKMSADLARAEAEGRAAGSLSKSTMFWIPFIAVLREGIETVIFLAGVGATYPLKSIPLAGITGLIAGLFCGWLLFAVGGKCTMKIFLWFSTVLLMFIAAGLAMYGAHEFQEAGMFGDPDAEPPSAMNDPVWNICDCCSNSEQPWDIFRALFGYTCAPTPWEILIYCVYWVLALTFLTWKLGLACFSYRHQGEVKEVEVADGGVMASPVKPASSSVAPVDGGDLAITGVAGAPPAYMHA